MTAATFSVLDQFVPVATKMLFHNKGRLALSLTGIAIAFFLAAAQFGLLVGWINTNSAIIRHAGVDVWVMAPQTPAFDYGTPIPRNRLCQVRSMPGIAWAEGLFMAWNIWQRGDGRRVNVELVGLDESSQGGPWRMRAGSVDVVHLPHRVIVDELYMQALGVKRIGESFAMVGQQAIVGGISSGIRTFTASPFIFTSITSAIRYDKRYQDDEITYVIARCAPGFTPESVRDTIRAHVPQVEVLTTAQFALRTVQYWMLETGLGLTVVITAMLGLGIGVMIISQTLFAVTQDHLPNYATLLALGFSPRRLATIVLMQSLALGGCGIAGGSALFLAACYATAKTPIPLETTPLVFTGLMGVSLLASGLASFISVRSLFNLDPVSVFRV
jgi:putative ABC transport system permease protein